ncbi:Bug family tripartite tricarboxylate transporter substrate binding protein [Sabulicella glaciei]|uniref:Tripartite tricarboxylate transporter substrate binding protein n=1 Tax=Sabulicella glaciei TaxID=2984948 RepID=A0ABT3P220_9PROT|nr:tripartite tricarboxylate transporter substrate binding protein [Roseococcus sp. MDT2-1-1]MCW8088238.1 tripartite tricarboxylate transporter substrate binding protein [Roseococcus sp. MDT2-1-1]
MIVLVVCQFEKQVQREQPMSKPIERNRLTFACALGAMLMGAAPVLAQTALPDRQLRIISGFAPGGSSDTLTRIIADAISPTLGQRVLVENRTGVNGVVTAAYVAQSPPDGTMIYQCSMSTLAITPQLQGVALPLDPGRDTTPIANVALSSYGLFVGANSEYRTVADVLAAARARPGQITFASPGAGSAQHLSGELMKGLANVDMAHVPYRGTAPALLDLLAGRIDFMIGNLGDATRQTQSGDLRLLGIGDPTRSPVFPDAPRISDTVPGFNVTGWFGMCGHKDMPDALRQVWANAIGRALEDAAVRQRLEGLGFTPHFESTADFTRRLEADRRSWREVIRAGNIAAN